MTIDSERDRYVHRLTAYGEHLGMEILRTEDGEAEVRMDLQSWMCNRRRVAHGGALASLLDTALGGAVIASMRPEEWCATLQLSLQFLDPARVGPLVGKGRLLRRGRRVAFAEGEVVDGDGRVVARAHGTWTIWPRHPDQPQRE